MRRHFGLLGLASVLVVTTAVPAAATASTPTASVAQWLPGLTQFTSSGPGSGGYATRPASDQANADTVLTRVSGAGRPLARTVVPPTGTSAPLLAGGSVWLLGTSGAHGADQPDGGLLLRFDPTTLKLTGSVAVGDRYQAVAAGLGQIWIVVGNQLLRVDATTMAVTARSTFRHGYSYFNLNVLQLAAGYVWLLDDTNDGGPARVIKVNPRTMQERVVAVLHGVGGTFAAGASRLWLTYNAGSGGTRVREIDAATGRTVLDRVLSKRRDVVRALASDPRNQLWYLTASGLLGRVSPLGTVVGHAVEQVEGLFCDVRAHGRSRRGHGCGHRRRRGPDAARLTPGRWSAI